MTTQLCPRCRFHPASPRIGGLLLVGLLRGRDDEDADEEDGDRAA